MEIEIPIRGERAEVAKRPVVREEVEIGKDVRESAERVPGAVKREEVPVEGDDSAQVDRDRARGAGRTRRR
jgi:uncharacterized protein (TIGR02271 family)